MLRLGCLGEALSVENQDGFVREKQEHQTPVPRTGRSGRVRWRFSRHALNKNHGCRDNRAVVLTQIIPVRKKSLICTTTAVCLQTIRTQRNIQACPNHLCFNSLRYARFFRLKEGVLIAVPELTVHQVRPTANGLAFLVLGSDGLWEGVRDSKVRRLLPL